jgi:signal transduction histidine kinase
MTAAKKYVIIITFFMFLTICGIIFFSKYSTQQVEQMMTEEFIGHMLEMTNTAVISIENDINATKIVATIARDEMIEHDFYADNEDFKQDFLNFHTSIEKIQVFDIRYIDENGIVRYSINSPELIGGNVSADSVFNTIRDRNDPYHLVIKQVGLKRGNKEGRYLQFSLGVLTGDRDAKKKEFKGMIAIVASLEGFIKKHIKDIPMVHEGYAWLFKSDGTVLSHPKIPADKTSGETRSLFLNKESIRQAIENLMGSSDLTSKYMEDGRIHLSAASKVKVGSDNWYIAISIPEEETLPLLKNFASINFLLTSTALFAVFLFGFFLILIFYVRNKKLLDTVDIQTYQLDFARKTNRELDTIIQTIAHDLKSPLVSVMGFSDLLLENASKHNVTDEGVRLLSRVNINASYMKNLVDSLLEFARIGEISSNIEDISLKDVLKKAKAQLHYVIEERGAVVNIPKDLPIIHADRLKITQVFLNLISNAVKFVPKDKTPVVNITLDEDDEYYNISVIDNGIGVSEKELGNIFKIFHRVEDIKVSGTGVGLAIVKKILDDHGGRISAKSREGSGTEFIVSLKKYPVKE